AIVFAIAQIGGGSSSKPKPNVVAPAAPVTSGKGGSAKAPAASAANTTVAVLNGTTLPGLARSVADRLQSTGYKIGAVTNAPDQQRSATSVAYQGNHRAEAEQIASIIKVGADAVTKIDPVTAATAGDTALVVVTVGSDQRQQ
ncbi:MAG TPA: LytR C-terminal domain-containing protein, partial [Solirubrobacteraceae bacterium]